MKTKTDNIKKALHNAENTQSHIVLSQWISFLELLDERSSEPCCKLAEDIRAQMTVNARRNT